MLLAGCGWVLAAIGLVLLADAQRRNAGSSLGALLRSPVGHALIWRGVAIGAAGAALLVALFGWLLGLIGLDQSLPVLHTYLAQRIDER
jgi:hypothetical protein